MPARVKITTREIGDARGRTENKNENVSHFLSFCVDNLQHRRRFSCGFAFFALCTIHEEKEWLLAVYPFTIYLEFIFLDDSFFNILLYLP